jgi:hypothetical protein
MKGALRERDDMVTTARQTSGELRGAFAMGIAPVE